MSKIQVNDIVNHFDDGAPNFPKGIVVGSGATLGFNVGTGASIYSPSDNVLTLGTNNSERLRITSGGDVNIGPSANANGHGLLTLSQSASAAFNALVIQQGNTAFTATDGLQIGIDAGVNAYFKLYENRDFYFTTGTSNTEKLRITSAGLVGIGTDNPAHKLEVQSGGNGTFFISGKSSTGVDIFKVYESSNGDGNNGMLYLQNGSDVTNIKLSTNGVSYFNGGNVGINKTAPADRLHVGGKIRFGNNNTYYGVIEHEEGVTGANIYTSADSGGHIFKKSTTTQAEINDTGIKLPAGAGINFSAYATSGNPNSNLLDDYEEGTWTPGLYVNSGTHPTLTVTSNYSSYTKIGSLVTFSADFVATISSVGSGTGLRISLPFAASIASGRQVYSGGPQGRASTGLKLPTYEISWYYYTDGARLYQELANGGENALSPSSVNSGTGKRFCIGGFYYVD